MVAKNKFLGKIMGEPNWIRNKVFEVQNNFFEVKKKKPKWFFLN